MRRPCILIVTACLLGELLGYYISILKLGVICVIPVSVCFILVFKKTIQIKKIYILIFFIVFSIFTLRIKYEIRFEKEFVSQNMNNVKENSGICGNIKSISFKDDRVIFISKGMIYYLDADKFDGDIHIGNKVCFYGKVEQISSGSNPGEFDAKSYYRTKSIYCKMAVKKYTVVDKSYDFAGQFFFNLRQYLIRRIDSIFDNKSAGLIKAIILGVRADLDRDVYKMYQKNGIAHLLAISGLHVSLLGIGLYKLLRKVLQRSFLFSAGFSSIFLLFYGLLVGDGVSIVRAGSMLVLYFIAEVLGRSYCLISALCISATAICLISPFEVRAALAKTLTQIDGIDYISIRCGDQPLFNALGENVGLISSSNFINSISNVNSFEKATLTLYFSDDAGTKLVAETRDIFYDMNTSKEKLIVDELMKGPKTAGLKATIPGDTKVISVTVNEGICYVNFDEGFLNALPDVLDSITIYSIVDSLSELPNITRVQILVNGKSDKNYNSISLGTSVERNLDYVKEEK